MSVLALPSISRTAIRISLVILSVDIVLVFNHPAASFWLIIPSLLISGFVADAFTGIAHFCFDYVFPIEFPIFGPIAHEFHQHHETPTLDPSHRLENFTKGAYASIPVGAATLLIALLSTHSRMGFIASCSFLGMSILALCFHQIHAYSHMGSDLPADVFNAKVAEASRLPSKREQMAYLGALFDTVPVPRWVRLLQKSHLILSPERHNLHHIHFETDFSSVNGWSDPLLNLVLGPIARRYKQRGNLAVNLQS